MGQAEGLLAEGQSGRYDHVPAAVLAAAVLEETLRALCGEQQPPITLTNAKGEKKTLNPLIDDLKKAGVFNELKAKQLRSWADIRNKAAHGEFDQFTKTDVEQMLHGINNFLADFRESPREAETTASATGAEASYCASLSSPALDRPAGWEFRREVWRQGDEAIVDRVMANGTTKGDPQAGLAALRLAEMPVESKAAGFLKTLAGYSIYAPDTPILRAWTQDPQVREPVGLSGGRLAEAVCMSSPSARRGRDTGCPVPPSQIPAGGIPAPGSSCWHVVFAHRKVCPF